jgi:hypothetical protein
MKVLSCPALSGCYPVSNIQLVWTLDIRLPWQAIVARPTFNQLDAVRAQHTTLRFRSAISK